MGLCIFNIIQRNFRNDNTIFLSIADAENELQKEEMQSFGLVYIVDLLLQNINNELRWSYHVSNDANSMTTSENETIYQFDIFITFSFPDEGSVLEQFEYLSESSYWNCRAKFLIIIIGESSESPVEISRSIIKALWEYYKISEIVILIPVEWNNSKVSKIYNNSRINLYTWKPYQSTTECAEVKNVNLVDTWVLKDSGFSENISLYNYGIPKYFYGCPLRVTAMSLPPFIIEHNTENLKFSGYDERVIHLICQTMNMSLVHVTTQPGTEIEVRMNALQDLIGGVTDVISGGYVFHPAITPFADPVESFMENIVEVYVPCGTPASRVKKISQIFKLSVWLLIGVQFILSVMVISIISNLMSKISKETALSISNSVHIVYAIMLSVSLTKLPFSNEQRLFFLMLIWYAFSLSVVFQTFFTSVLINPGINEQIRTFDELMESNLIYYCLDTIEEFMNFTSPSFYSKIKLEKRSIRQKSLHLMDYFENDNAVILGFDAITEYHLLSSLPIGIDIPKLCSLDQYVYNMKSTVYLSKGSPLLKRVNSIIRRSLETGIIEKLSRIEKQSWRKKISNITIKFTDVVIARMNIYDTGYFIFSLSHLQFIFYILGMGYVSAFLVLVAEILYFTAHFHLCKKYYS